MAFLCGDIVINKRYTYSQKDDEVLRPAREKFIKYIKDVKPESGYTREQRAVIYDFYVNVLGGKEKDICENVEKFADEYESKGAVPLVPAIIGGVASLGKGIVDLVSASKERKQQEKLLKEQAKQQQKLARLQLMQSMIESQARIQEAKQKAKIIPYIVGAVIVIVIVGIIAFVIARKK